MGPTFIPDHLAVVCAGMLMIGGVCCLSFIPCLPEAIDQTMIRFRIVEGANEELDTAVHETLSSLNTLIINASSLVSPIIGGALYDSFGYVLTSQVSAVLMLLLTCLYLFFNCSFNVFSDTKKEQDILQELKKKKE